jgi:hypothetical protein
MPLNMELPFAHSNVAAVEGAWPVMGFTSHQQMHGEPSDRIVGCWVLPLPSPTPWWSVRTTPPCVTHAGNSSEVGQREHMVRLGIHRKCWWSEFLCLGGYLAPLRQVGVCAPRDALGRPPPPPTPAAGAPPAGPWQEPIRALSYVDRLSG